MLLSMMFSVATLLPVAADRSVPQTTWPMYQYAANRNAVFQADGWDVSWKASIGAKSNGGLALVGHTIYVESFDRSVYAFDAATGRQIWRAPLSDIAMGSPIVANGLVIVGTGSNAMSHDHWAMQRPQGDDIDAFDAATGRLIWQYRTVGENMPTGVYIEAAGKPEYVFSNGDEHAYALEATTGRLLWKTQLLGINAMSDLATDGRAVYGISEYTWARLFEDELRPSGLPSNARGWTWSLDPASGWVNWLAAYGVADGGVTVADGTVILQDVLLVSPKGAQAVERYHAIGDALLNEAHWSTRLVAVSSRTGKVKWQYIDSPNLRSFKTSGTFSTTGTAVNGTLYDPLQISRSIAAFDVASGHLLWKTATLAPVKMAIIYKDHLLYAGDTDGNFYVLDATTGTIRQTVHFPAPFSPSPPIIAGDTLYVVNGSTLYAVRLADLRRGVISLPQ